jgi:hypothetical protein
VALLLPPPARGEVGDAALDLAGERERGPADLGVIPARFDADVDVDALRARGLRVAAQAVGSRSTRSSSGWSRSARREGCGLKSMTPRFTAQTRCAASLATSSSAVRPDGNATVAVCSHSGMLFGTRFCQIGSSRIPFTKRFITVGRSRRWTSTASAFSR